MSALTNIQVINDKQGNPVFVVIPYVQYMASLQRDNDWIPNEVVGRMVDGATPIRAWREHLGLLQTDMAQRLGISQAAYAQQEAAKKPRKVTREKIAQALGIAPELLDV